MDHIKHPERAPEAFRLTPEDTPNPTAPWREETGQVVFLDKLTSLAWLFEMCDCPRR